MGSNWQVPTNQRGKHLYFIWNSAKVQTWLIQKYKTRLLKTKMQKPKAKPNLEQKRSRT
jgi:hypothetical protein